MSNQCCKCFTTPDRTDKANDRDNSDTPNRVCITETRDYICGNDDAERAPASSHSDACWPGPAHHLAGETLVEVSGRCTDTGDFAQGELCTDLVGCCCWDMRNSIGDDRMADGGFSLAMGDPSFSLNDWCVRVGNGGISATVASRPLVLPLALVLEANFPCASEQKSGPWHGDEGIRRLSSGRLHFRSQVACCLSLLGCLSTLL